MSRVKPTSLYPYSRESLQELDQGTLIDLLLNLDAKYQQLGDYVRDLVNSKYASRNERFENPDQLLLFPGSSSEMTEDLQEREPEPKEEPNPSSRKRKSGHTRKPPAPELPRVPVVASPPDVDAIACSRCGTDRIPARHILQNTRLQFIPASFYYEDLYSVVYSCPNHCHSSENIVATVPEPVKNGLAAASLLAQVAVARDFDHSPFNRQSTIYKRHGAPLERSTICDFYAHVARILTPLYTFMHLLLLQSKIISTDDTPVKVQDRSKKKNIKTGRKWAFLGDEQHPVNLFHYTEGRGREGPLEFLSGWKGLLQGDCFSGNIAISAAAGTILAACMAHARRYFIKAMLNDRQGCNHALTMFQSLYEIERTARQLNVKSDELKLMREQEAVPLLDEFHA